MDQSSVDRPWAGSYRHGYLLIVERSTNDVSDSQDQLAQTLRSLQASGNQCARWFTSHQLQVEFQVAFSNGAPLPWRLVEIHRAVKDVGKPRLLRRMHCFSSAEALNLSIRERTNWKARDRALVTSHWVRVRASLAKAPSHKNSDQGTEASDDSKAELLALTATRQALRAQMCLTRPGRVVDLPNR